MSKTRIVFDFEDDKKALNFYNNLAQLLMQNKDILPDNIGVETQTGKNPMWKSVIEGGFKLLKASAGAVVDWQKGQNKKWEKELKTR